MDMAKRRDLGAKIPEQVLDELLKGVVKPEPSQVPWRVRRVNQPAVTRFARNA